MEKESSVFIVKLPFMLLAAFIPFFNILLSLFWRSSPDSKVKTAGTWISRILIWSYLLFFLISVFQLVLLF